MTARRRVAVGYAAIFAGGTFLAALLSGCASNNVDLDPRDEAAVVEGWEDCDRDSGMAILRVRNKGSTDVRITLVPGGGGGRTLREAATGFKTTDYRVSRSMFSSGGYLVLQVARGGLTSGPAYVFLAPIMCDVGTLDIAPVLSMSMFYGADLQ
jgi:hypothetical protein